MQQDHFKNPMPAFVAGTVSAKNGGTVSLAVPTGEKNWEGRVPMVVAYVQIVLERLDLVLGPYRASDSPQERLVPDLKASA
jgi:hypothetical protein